MDEVPEKSNVGCDLFDDFIRFSSRSVADFVLLKISCDFDRRFDADFLIEKLDELMHDGTGLSVKDDVDWTEWVGAVLLMTPTDLDQYAQIQKVKSWNYWAGDLKMI